MEVKDFVSIERAKATSFNLMTALLCQPTEDLISNPEFLETLKSSFKIVCPDCVENVEQMQHEVKKYSQLNLLVEYTRLLIGPFGTLAPPYSSLYFGGSSMMSEETVWVINFYESVGLSFDLEAIKDAPDHVAVETEFMYYLIFNEINELESGNVAKAKQLWNSQCEFFSKHYKQWLPKFCQKITEHTNNDYYKALAECINKFVSTVSIPEFPIIAINSGDKKEKLNNIKQKQIKM